MKFQTRLPLAALCLALLVFVPASCNRRKVEMQAFDEIDRRAAVPAPVEPVKRDLAEIKEQGTLTVLAPYNSTTYFLYRGEPMGYEYELLQAFARDQGLVIKMHVITDRKSVYSMLNSGDGDIAAARLVPTDEDKKLVNFTRELYRTEPALVQQEAEPEDAKMPEVAKKALKPAPEAPPLPEATLPEELEISARRITRPAQLAGETVTLPEKSPYMTTLIELADEISGEIHVVELGGKIGDEALAQKVASGEVEFTVMQANVAELKEAEFKNLKVRPVVGRVHSVTWAVRRNAPGLEAALNSWIAENKNTALFNTLYKKYFVDRKKHVERAASKFLTSSTGKLCEYDHLLKQYAAELGWDWRLLASQAYQESRFKPDARSWAGATGLLQLMPRTAKEFGVTDIDDPAQNVQGAVKFLQWLTRHWTKRIDDEGERLKFILASYNTGAGHVEDAQRLAEKYGNDPERWEHVSYWLLQKSTQQYSTDPVVKFGFCRGVEPVQYVSSILDRFDHYRQFVVTRRTPKPAKRRARATTVATAIN